MAASQMLNVFSNIAYANTIDVSEMDDTKAIDKGIEKSFSKKQCVRTNNASLTSIRLNESCEILLNYPKNGDHVKPIFYQDNYIILLDWADGINTEEQIVSYALQIWNINDPTNIDYYETIDSYKYLIADDLQTYDTYKWRIVAMGIYGPVCHSQPGYFIKIDPSSTDGFSYSHLKISDEKCHHAISNASIQTVNATMHPITIVQIKAGFFHIQALTDTSDASYLLQFSAPGYKTTQFNYEPINYHTKKMGFEKKINLEDIIHTLKILSGFSVQYDCMNHIDLCKDSMIDVCDVVSMLKFLSIQ